MKPAYFLVLVSVLLAGCTALPGSPEEQTQTGQMQLPVGENAWDRNVQISITDRLEPADVELGKDQVVIWKNLNNFPVTIKMRGLDRDFTLLSNESVSFKPTGSFEYTVSGRGESIGSGRVSLEK